MPTTMSCLRLCQLSPNEAVLLFIQNARKLLQWKRYSCWCYYVNDDLCVGKLHIQSNRVMHNYNPSVVKMYCQNFTKITFAISNLRAYYSWLCKTNCICRLTYYVNVCQVKYTIFMYIVLTKLLKREQIIIGNRKYGFWIYCHTWWKVTLAENYSKLRGTLVQQITCVKSNYILNRDLFF